MKGSKSIQSANEAIDADAAAYRIGTDALPLILGRIDAGKSPLPYVGRYLVGPIQTMEQLCHYIL